MDSTHLLRRLNPYCTRALSAAASLCQSRGHTSISIEHWLLKLLEQGEGDLPLIARRCGWDIDALWQGLLDHLASVPRSLRGKPKLCSRLQQLIRDAWLNASLGKDATTLRSAHLLGALSPALLNCESLLPLLGLSELDIDRLMPALDTCSEERPQAGPAVDISPSCGAPITPAADNLALSTYTHDLVAQARAGRIDPVFGRDDEIRQVIDILGRRRKNNPILVGEPGVGKTALVEGLALRIAEGQVPTSLKGVGVRTLDLGLLQAGAGVKGEFESRLQAVIEAVRHSSQPLLLFVDEAHTLIGAGNQAGGADAANLLKPALARGELRTIAATT